MRGLADRLGRLHAPLFVAAVARDESTGQRVALEPFQRDVVRVVTGADRGAVELPPEHGKSSIAAACVAWLLGRDPTLRVALVSGTLAQATRQLGSVARLCESPDAQRVFPTLAPGEPWTQSSLALAARPPELRDPNVVAASLDGAGLLGARVDLVVADDVDSLATTSTPAARDAAWRWFASTVLSRLSPRGRVVVLSTTWHREDVLHRFVDLGRAEHLRLPIQDAAGRPLWPSRWPAERIAARRKELGPRLAARVLDCRPVSDDAAVFDSALVRGMVDRGLALPTTLFDGPRGRCVVGVDVAFSTGASSDESALVVVRCVSDGVREVVHVEAGRWNLDALSGRAVEVARAFGATVAVESNGGGGFAYEQIRKHVPAVALHTSATNKAARVEALHAEMSAARWHFRPADGRLTEGMRALAEGLENYSPNEHTDDRVAALLVAVEQIRAHESKPKVQFGRLDLLRR